MRVIARRFPLLAAVVLAAIFFGSGCAIRYHDSRTATEHIWGFSHVKVRPASPASGTAPDASRAVAVATQVETFGLGLGITTGQPARATPGDAGLALGWNRSTRIFLTEDAALALEWPSVRLFDIRVGAPPTALPPASTADPAAPETSASAPAP